MSIKEDTILTRALDKKISRRSFIKWSSAIGATASMSGLIMQTGAKMAGAGSTNKPATGTGGTVVEWKPTCCLVCHSWCHIAVGLDAYGHARKIEGCGGQPATYSNGNPVKHLTLASTATAAGGWGNVGNVVDNGNAQKPDDANYLEVGEGFLAYAPHNKGRICAKGNDGLEHLYNAERLKYPLQRLGDRGEGRWKRITWEDALGQIANVLRDLAQAGNRHRFVHWIGRNEHYSPGRFSKAYGTPNEIQHTSLCELSRHTAGRSMWGHHWNSMDLETHRDDAGQTIPGAKSGDITLSSDLHDSDFYLEWGGNPAEAKIPHTTCANHMADRRRTNLQGYDGTAGNRTTGGTVYGRICVVDVRQSNTAAFADEAFTIIPGTDGALALGIIHGVMLANSSLQDELDGGQMGTSDGLPATTSDPVAATRKYYGIFSAEEVGGAASGTATTAVPAGKSLESYLNDAGAEGFSQNVGAGGSVTWGAIKTAVALECGLTETQVQYLTDVYTGGVYDFQNVVTDCYRGPCKHTNGVYNTRAVRTLQIIAPNYAASQYHVGGVSGARGGYNTLGGFQSDKNWDGYNAGGGVPGSVGGTKPGGANNVVDNGGGDSGSVFPMDHGMGGGDASPSDRRRIDNWDYDADAARWRGSYKWVDQNLAPAIRFSLGMHPYNVGEARPGGIDGPYHSSNTPTTWSDNSFKVEALLIHKNAPTACRPNQDSEIEMLTKKDSNGNYILANFWAIDIAVGDGSRFADIILPDVSYLERYSGRSGEGQEYNFRDNTFYRVPVYGVDGPTVHGEVLPRRLYDSRQVQGIYYSLARTIENSDTGVAPWSGSLYDSYKFHPSDAGSVAANAVDRAYINDGEWIADYDFASQTTGANLSNAATAAGAASGTDYMLTHAMYFNPKDSLAVFPGSFEGAGEETDSVSDSYRARGGFKAGSVATKLLVFSNKLDTTPDVEGQSGGFATKADGTLYGTPVYIPTAQQTSGTYPLHLTTYKLNVHTQSRTAYLPRLNEMIGNSWAVIHPDTAAAATNGPVANGDTVRVTSAAGAMDCVAKVSSKAQANCVHISTSQGHQAGIWTVAPDSLYYNKHREAFGKYKVSDQVAVDDDGNANSEVGLNKTNRHLGNAINNPNSSTTSPVDSYVLALPPSAPGKGVHPNKIIQHSLPSGSVAGGDNLATDPVGGSQAWFDTKVNIVKI